MFEFVEKTSMKSLDKRPIQTHIPKSLPLVSLDEGLIKEVLIHLISNAVKFTPPMSPINISVHLEHNKVVVSIEDSGAGVELDEREQLFETFYRGKKLTAVHGVGLGLAICHKIIVAHGGNIWVENLDKKGAAFRFSLPM